MFGSGSFDHESLNSALELILLRVRCGQTLFQALHGLPEVKAPAPVVRDWLTLRERALEGRLSSEAALVSLLRNLKFRARTEQLIRQKTLAGRIQAGILVVLGALLWLLSNLIFPEALRPSLTLSLASLGLMGVGLLWIRRELHRFDRSLWFGDWLLFLSRVAASLGWGQSLGPALDEIFEAARAASWPSDLRSELQDLIALCRSGGTSPGPVAAAAKADTKKSLEVGRAFEHLRWMRQLYLQGLPLAATLDSSVEHSFEAFERRISLQAEALGFRLLMPLFSCFFPAIMALLLGPLLGALRNF